MIRKALFVFLISLALCDICSASEVIATSSYIATASELDINIKYEEREQFVYIQQFGHENYQRALHELCLGTGMDYLFFLALGMLESSLTANAQHFNVGGAAPGSIDRGLFQINSKWENGFFKDELHDVFNPWDNIIATFERQKEYFRKYHDYDYMMAAWNKGQQKFNSDYTQFNYVKLVNSYYTVADVEYSMRIIEVNDERRIKEDSSRLTE